MPQASPTFSPSQKRLALALQADSAPELLATLFPPLQTYCPILPTVSKQQSVFLLAEEEEAFYGGAVGGGKTAALLMAALQFVDVPDYAALILRRTFPELEQPGNLIPLSTKWFATAPETVRPRYNQQEHAWTFPSGAVIRFGHLDNPNSMIRYQGGGYHFLGYDELTHFEEEAYEFISFSRTRKPGDGPLADVPIRVRATANPGGPGHSWVKRRFITERAPDVLFVPATVWDNPGIDTDDYVKRLGKMNETLRLQLLHGDWEAFEGAAFPQFSPTLHLVDEFPLEESYDRFECMDFGINNPTAWYLVAVDYEGNLVFHDSHYAPGLPSVTAPTVLGLREASWGVGNYCYADPSIQHRTGGRSKHGQPATITSEFSDNGISLLLGNNDPRAGYARLKELIEPDPARVFPAWHPRYGEPGSPRLFVVGKRCKELAEQLSSAPLQPIDKPDGGEKVDPEWESRYGHAVAAARYGAMSRPDPSVEPKLEEPDPRRARMLEIVERERAEDEGGGQRDTYPI